MPTYHCLHIDQQHLEWASISSANLSLQAHWPVAAEAVLPPEFIREKFLPAAMTRPDWTGLWIFDESNTLVGSGGFKDQPDTDGVVEIGYGIAPAHQNRGAATFLCGQMVEWAFGHGAKKVIAHTLPDGQASQRVLQRNGFVKTDEYEDPEDGWVWRWERAG